MKITFLDQLQEENLLHHPEMKKGVMLHQGDLAHLTNFSQSKLQLGDRVL